MSETLQSTFKTTYDWPAVKGEIAFVHGPFYVDPAARAATEALMGPVRRWRAALAAVEGGDFFAALKS